MSNIISLPNWDVNYLMNHTIEELREMDDEVYALWNKVRTILAVKGMEEAEQR